MTDVNKVFDNNTVNDDVNNNIEEIVNDSSTSRVDNVNKKSFASMVRINRICLLLPPIILTLDMFFLFFTSVFIYTQLTSADT